MKPAPAAYKRIATEEAFATTELLEGYRRVLATPPVDPGFQSLMGFYMVSPSERAQHIMRCLVDLDAVRIGHMDEAGIDVQVLALTSPGVQVFARAEAVALARDANDQLAARGVAGRARSRTRKSHPRAGQYVVAWKHCAGDGARTANSHRSLSRTAC